MRIGIDVDDVCANFQKRFVELLNSLHGKPPLDTVPVDWEFSNAELTQAQIDEGWAESRNVEQFWFDIEPLPSFDLDTVRLLKKAVSRHDVYFITNRYPTLGLSPLKQTKAWFDVYAGISAPNVIIAKDKGPVATMLELDAFVDDRPKNVVDVLTARPSAKVFLANASHNQTFNDAANRLDGVSLIPRVKDLKEFLKLILEAN